MSIIIKTNTKWKCDICNKVETRKVESYVHTTFGVEVMPPNGWKVVGRFPNRKDLCSKCLKTVVKKKKK